MNNLRILAILWVLAAAWTVVLLLVFSWSPEPPPVYVVVTTLIQYFGPFAFVLASLSIRVDTRAGVYRNLAVLGWTAISVAFAVSKADSRTVDLIIQIANGVPILIGWYLGPICLFWSLIERAESLQNRRFNRSGKMQKCGYCVAALAIAVGISSIQPLLLRGDDFAERLWERRFLAFASGIAFYLISLGLFTSRGGPRQGFLIVLAVVFVIAEGLISAKYPDLIGTRMADRSFRRMGVMPRSITVDSHASGIAVASIVLTWSILPLWLMLWVIDWTTSRGLWDRGMVSEDHCPPDPQHDENPLSGA